MKKRNIELSDIQNDNEGMDEYEIEELSDAKEFTPEESTVSVMSREIRRSISKSNDIGRSI